jgi:hypothetical protein
MRWIFLFLLLVVGNLAANPNSDCIVSLAADGGKTTESDRPLFKQWSPLLAEIWREDPNYWYLARGVAPTEAKVAEAARTNLPKGRDGRLTGLSHYGIKDKSKPGFLLNEEPVSQALSNADKQKSEDLFADDGFFSNPTDHVLYDDVRKTLWKTAAGYADDGANAEAMEALLRARYEKLNLPFDLAPREIWKRVKALSDEIRSKHRGKILVYRVPRSVQLEWHPESVASPKHRVFKVPDGAELFGVLPSPSQFDASGFPSEEPSSTE